MFNIDFEHIILNNLPPRKRKPIRIAWLNSLIMGIMTIYDEFLSYKEDVDYKLIFRGQKAYMEKLLNDYYSDTGIEIVNLDPADKVYIANKVTGYTTTYIYCKYKAATAYVVDDEVSYEGKIYECIQAGTGQQPDISPTYWSELSDATFIGTKAYYDGLFDFKVRVPAALYATMDQNECRSLINEYKLAGKTYYFESY